MWWTSGLIKGCKAMSVAARNSTCVELHSAASYRIYMYLPYFQRQKLSETRQKLRGKSMISLGVLWGSQMSISRIAAADLQLGNSPSSPVSSNCWHVLSCLLTVLQLIRVMSYHSYHVISFHILVMSQWISLRENLQETIDFPIKYGVFL